MRKILLAGALVVIVNVDRTRKLQNLIAAELNKHTDPARIIDMLKSEESDKMAEGPDDGNY